MEPLGSGKQFWGRGEARQLTESYRRKARSPRPQRHATHVVKFLWGIKRNSSVRPNFGFTEVRKLLSLAAEDPDQTRSQAGRVNASAFRARGPRGSSQPRKLSVAGRRIAGPATMAIPCGRQPVSNVHGTDRWAIPDLWSRAGAPGRGGSRKASADAGQHGRHSQLLSDQGAPWCGSGVQRKHSDLINCGRGYPRDHGKRERGGERDKSFGQFGPGGRRRICDRRLHGQYGGHPRRCRYARSRPLGRGCGCAFHVSLRAGVFRCAG
jgi:hypothetical protein